MFLFPWAGFGAPSPYYQEDDGYLVCRYRRVRYHGHWVRRRYCWRRILTGGTGGGEYSSTRLKKPLSELRDGAAQ